MRKILYFFVLSFFIVPIIGCEETMPISSNQRELKPPAEMDTLAMFAW